ncbi:MAG: CydX/CbdX family cytochrome bd oxidase small subunit [Alphaproteobacteria bacterium]|nr:CydX/CbdX family cytochrome bd oxidase small subunit [Alphaproteobacteria bacterium]
MTVEVSLMISILSVGFAIAFGIINTMRNKKTDDQREAADMTAVMIKLEKIADDTSEIKNDLKSLKTDVRHNSESIIRLDESLKSAWKQINEINAQLKRG